MNDSFFPFQWNDITRYCLTSCPIDRSPESNRCYRCWIAGIPLGLFSVPHRLYSREMSTEDRPSRRRRCRRGAGATVAGKGEENNGGEIGLARTRSIGRTIRSHTWGRLPIGKHRCVHRDSAPWSLINARIRGGRGPFTRCIDGTRASGALWSTPGFRE